MVEEILVEHVLPVKNDIVQHFIAKNGCEEPRHSVVIRVSLVKVTRLREEEKRGKGIGIAVKPEFLGLIHFRSLDPHVWDVESA